MSFASFTASIRAGTSPKPSCEVVLESCKKAVDDLDLAEESKKILIQAQDTQIKALSREVEDEKAWYHNPFIMGALGLSIGVLGGVYAAKH
jgi:hypothetical protein